MEIKKNHACNLFAGSNHNVPAPQNNIDRSYLSVFIEWASSFAHAPIQRSLCLHNLMNEIFTGLSDCGRNWGQEISIILWESSLFELNLPILSFNGLTRCFMARDFQSVSSSFPTSLKMLGRLFILCVSFGCIIYHSLFWYCWSALWLINYILIALCYNY